MKYKKTLLSSFISTLAILSTSQTLHAASTTDQAPKKRSALMEEVMVTAQKKAIAESAQDVPVAISAYSGDKVEAMFATNISDIGLTSPNVSLTPLFPGVGNFSIRGMGTGGQSIPSSDPAVGIVVDGISYGTIYGVLFDVFDLESIEILRGPQGTLFGRNVTGGVVSVRTSRPTDEFQGKIKATLGSHDTRDLMATVSGPLNDSWSAKLAVLAKDHGDYWDYEFQSGGIGKSETLVIRPALKYSGQGWDMTAIAEYGDIDSDGTALRNFWVDGVERGRYSDNQSTQDEDGLFDQEWTNLSLEANIDLWSGVVTTVVGFRELEQQQFFDIDGVPASDRFHFAPGTNMEQDQFSIESRWAGSISDTTYLTTGIYYFQQEYDYRERRFVANALDLKGSSNIQHDTFALFGQVNFALTDNLTLTLGGRYSQESKDADIGVIGDPNGVGDCQRVTSTPFDRSAGTFNDCAYAFSDSEDWSNFTPKLALDWRPNDNLLLYASYTRGFKSGGYNTRFTDTTLVTNPPLDLEPNSTPGPYDEEVVDAYEIGMKSDWMNGRIRLNVALFYNEYEDLQRTALSANGAQATLNAAGAEVQGVELETVILLTDTLIFEGSYGYLDTEYTEFDYLEAATGRAADNFQFTMVPDKTSSMALTHELDLGNGGRVASRISYVYVDKTVGDDFNRSQISQYELYNTSISYIDSSDALKITLYGRNLKDEIYANYANDLSGTSIATKATFLTPPRTYGVELSYRF
ncbi:MAG: TonB-dependent receptor [Gammaproteobacteria bacterium]|nr:TonB-dependent receptor [Gammaproteobacteria bacterium]